MESDFPITACMDKYAFCSNSFGLSNLLRALTLGFRAAVEREFSISFLFVAIFCDSVSIDGKSGVPGGVRSLRNRRDYKEWLI